MCVKTIIINFLLSIALLCISFCIAWHLSAATNFFYSSWYEVINIDETVITYAPKNKNRNGFEKTSKQERLRLFAGIVTAIQNKGEGLRQLKYVDSQDTEIDTLLTEAEVVHLQDVANLVDKFKYLLFLGCSFAVVAFMLMRVMNIKLGSIKIHLLGGLGLILTIVVAILIVGPTKVFYAAHELIFPDKHQWFFYYEDSLMSTMMKAPVLFGPIALQLLITTLLLWMVLLLITQKFKSKLISTI